MDQFTIDQALTSLLSIEGFTLNHTLKRRVYVTERVTKRKSREQGAVCMGHQACFIGSMFIGGGVPISYSEGTDGKQTADLPEASQGMRYGILANEPGIALAYDVTNNQARDYMHKHGIVGNGNFSHGGESLFESDFWVKEGRWGTEKIRTGALNRAVAEVIQASIAEVRDIARANDLNDHPRWEPIRWQNALQRRLRRLRAERKLVAA